MLLRFGLGQAFRSLIWCVTDLLIGYHLTARLALSGQTAGAILFGSFLLGAVLNVVVATWLARSEKTGKSVLGLQAGFGIASVAAALLLFGPLPFEGPMRVVYLCAASLVFRTCYTVFDVCQNALISLLPQQASDVRAFVLTKTFVSSAGRLLASGLVFVALRAPASDDLDFIVIGFVALPVAVSVIALARVTPLSSSTTHRTSSQFAWRSLPLRRLALPIVAIIFEVGLCGLTGRLIPLFGTVGPGFADGASLVVAMVCGTIGGSAVAYVSASSPARRVAVGSMLVLILVSAGVGVLFPNGLSIDLAFAFVYGTAVGGITNIIWEEVATIVTDVAAATGRRIDIPAFALLTAGINVAIAISNGLLAIVLDGFKTGSPASVAIIAVVLVIGGMGTALALAAAGGIRGFVVGGLQVGWRRPLSPTFSGIAR